MKTFKKILLGAIPVVAIIVAYGFYSFGAPKDIQLSQVSNKNNIPDQVVKNFSFNNFTFEGFSLFGESHVGTFEKFVTEDTKNFVDGKIIFQTNSIKTDDSGLDKHLCANDMLDCEKNPTTTFALQSILPTENSKNLQATGALSFFGTTQNLQFELTPNEKNTYQADFLFNSQDFGFKYPKIDEKVRIKFGAIIN